MNNGRLARRQQLTFVVAIPALLLSCGVSRQVAAETPPWSAVVATVRQYCVDCHGNELAEARINLEQLAAQDDLGRGFKDWEKVVRMLRQRKMPPQDADQPSAAERMAAVTAIERTLGEYIDRHAGDPGPVVLRRLTSAEYSYSIQDLTGLDLKLGRGFVSDAVGGEGFTNAGGAQFMQDSTLERYLEAARIVADHAVIGAGPLDFFADPGKTGLELSAIHRILRIYRDHGFRTAAGEGAEPFGLDQYPRALYVAWRFRHRAALGQGTATLQQLAREDGLSDRFCDHIWRVVNSPDNSFPLSLIADGWRSLPTPATGGNESAGDVSARARSACNDLVGVLREWQSTLAAAAGDEEEAAVLTEGEVEVQPRHSFTADVNWAEGAKTATFELSVTTASSRPVTGALVLWKNPRLRFRGEGSRRGISSPLVSHVTPESAGRLGFGRHPAGVPVAEGDFVLAGGTTAAVTIVVPEGRRGAQFQVDVQLDLERGQDRIVRCRISDGKVEGETAAEVGATSTLLGNPAGPDVDSWRAGVIEFARMLPEVSQREPAPSDRDPIPPPFDDTYNNPERNHYHYAVKYHRDDRFLVEHMLDDSTRRRLDDAWTDLLTSFDFHDANLRFLARKFELDLGDCRAAELDADAVDRLPEEPRSFARRWRNEYHAMQAAWRAAEPGHVDDALRLAELAWRRPLAVGERQRLREFYASLRRDAALDHTRALRALLTRILVAPAFLYRTEPGVAQKPADSDAVAAERSRGADAVPLSDWELASRLSYFLWSSLPDAELRRAAAAGELRDAEKLADQARRMLRDPKARRLAVEFFGQWFGFYQFDAYRGIDAARFPEFNEPLKSAMYEEANSFFEHIVREDRPVGEILFADYAFVNQLLARHYGMDAAGIPPDRHVRVDDAAVHQRGGLLGLAAVLTATSAPLRTSAVKRGDWVLRRVVGSPVPPPPADAGSIAADDVLADGLTVRQRLEAHRTDASCVNCHSRIDPLGFALEHFDPIGRWRSEYRDGRPIDSSGVLNDGTAIDGLDGLRSYLRRERPQFQRMLCGKLLGYALGRAEIASDRPLVDQMVGAGDGNELFSDLVVRIVTSRQFRYRRA
jgi:hypothetical protein